MIYPFNKFLSYLKYTDCCVSKVTKAYGIWSLLSSSWGSNENTQHHDAVVASKVHRRLHLLRSC
jgi:hypothetical protein